MGPGCTSKKRLAVWAGRSTSARRSTFAHARPRSVSARFMVFSAFRNGSSSKRAPFFRDPFHRGTNGPGVVRRGGRESPSIRRFADEHGPALLHLDGDLDVVLALVADAAGAHLCLVEPARPVIAFDALEVALQDAAIVERVIVDDAPEEAQELRAGRRGHLVLDVRIPRLCRCPGRSPRRPPPSLWGPTRRRRARSPTARAARGRLKRVGSPTQVSRGSASAVPRTVEAAVRLDGDVTHAFPPQCGDLATPAAPNPRARQRARLMLDEAEYASSGAAWPRPSLTLKEPIMTCIVWIPGTPGKWVHLDHGHADSFDFARVPAVGEFIRHTGRHYQIKLVTHDTPPGATPSNPPRGPGRVGRHAQQGASGGAVLQPRWPAVARRP